MSLYDKHKRQYISLQRRAIDKREHVYMTMPPTPAPWWWRFDPAVLLAIIVFVAVEVIAHFHYHNANGWYTLSNRLVRFQRRFGWPARIVVYGGVGFLALHLWGGLL